MILGPPPRRVVPTIWFWLALSGPLVLAPIVLSVMWVAESSHRNGLNELNRLGTRTEGKVESIERVNKGKDRSVGASYRAMGQTWRSWDEMPEEEAAGLVEGGPIPVIYLPASPSRAFVGRSIDRAIRESGTGIRVTLMLLGVVVSVGAGTIAFFYRNERRWLQNVPAYPGKILSRESGGLFSQRYVTYRYEWTSDRVRTGGQTVNAMYDFLSSGKDQVHVLQKENGDSRLAEGMQWAKVADLDGAGDDQSDDILPGRVM
ncbi:hypothetical protein EON79_13165 [bacterium]|nr:MAG: hypothetical protein EON79_13165 [bacterium]